jgi:hypothetical protein
MNGANQCASVALTLWTRFRPAAISLRNMVTASRFGGASKLLTNYEPVAVYLKRIGRRQGTRTMADRGALKFVGFIFATATLAVMLIAGMVVKGYADGAYTLEASTVEAAW